MSKCYIIDKIRFLEPSHHVDSVRLRLFQQVFWGRSQKVQVQGRAIIGESVLAEMGS
jgi:hypothetical protein